MTQPPSDPIRLSGASIFVRDLRIDAEIGVYDHEHGRTQPLLLEVELELATSGFEHIADTINYETIGQIALAVAATGHIKLVEHFADQMARACLADPRVTSVRVRVEKPEALAPAVAGVEIRLTRA